MMVNKANMLRQALVLVAISCGLYASLVAGASVITSRIVGGNAATEINLPWMASISNYGRHVCGGSIINKRTILTAAHCLRYADSVALLTVRVDTKTKSFGGQLITVESVKNHESFMPLNMDYDIGMIRLSRDIVFSDTVQPIALPSYREDVPGGSDAIVSGWGYYTASGPVAEFLQYAVVPVINQATCNRLMKYAITDRMLCAGVLEGGIDACQMDSGGPLVVDRKLVGVVSWGVRCALPNKPGVYTRIAELLPWVASYLRQFNETL